MAENYNLNSAFGYNVTNKKSSQISKNNTQSKEQLNESIGLFGSMTNFVKQYEDVFNGNVAKEINMYTRQSMIVGMNLKASDKNIKKFDINI